MTSLATADTSVRASPVFQQARASTDVCLANRSCFVYYVNLVKDTGHVGAFTSSSYSQARDSL